MWKQRPISIHIHTHIHTYTHTVTLTRVQTLTLKSAHFNMSTKRSQTRRSKKHNQKCKQIFFDMNLQSLTKTSKLNKKGWSTNQLELLNTSSISFSLHLSSSYTRPVSTPRNTSLRCFNHFTSLFDQLIFNLFNRKTCKQNQKRTNTQWNNRTKARKSPPSSRKQSQPFFAIV